MIRKKKLTELELSILKKTDILFQKSGYIFSFTMVYDLFFSLCFCVCPFAISISVLSTNVR